MFKAFALKLSVEFEFENTPQFFLQTKTRMKTNLINYANKKRALIIFLVLSIIFSSRAHAQVDTIQTTVPRLKDVYKNDFYIGCLLSYTHVGFPTELQSVLDIIARESRDESDRRGYAVLQQLSPLILANQGKGTMAGALLDSAHQKTQLPLGDFIFNVRHE